MDPSAPSPHDLSDFVAASSESGAKSPGAKRDDLYVRGKSYRRN